MHISVTGFYFTPINTAEQGPILLKFLFQIYSREFQPLSGTSTNYTAPAESHVYAFCHLFWGALSTHLDFFLISDLHPWLFPTTTTTYLFCIFLPISNSPFLLVDHLTFHISLYLPSTRIPVFTHYRILPPPFYSCFPTCLFQKLSCVRKRWAFITERFRSVSTCGRRDFFWPSNRAACDTAALLSPSVFSCLFPHLPYLISLSLSFPISFLLLLHPVDST